MPSTLAQLPITEVQPIMAALHSMVVETLYNPGGAAQMAPLRETFAHEEKRDDVDKLQNISTNGGPFLHKPPHKIARANVCGGRGEFRRTGATRRYPFSVSMLHIFD